MVPVERRQEASDEEDEFLSGEEQSGEGDDKSEFSVSEEEDGACMQHACETAARAAVGSPQNLVAAALNLITLSES